jgi:hypothetical protein
VDYAAKTLFIRLPTGAYLAKLGAQQPPIAAGCTWQHHGSLGNIWKKERRIGMTSRFLLVLDISGKKEGGCGMTSRFLPALEIFRKKERRF